MLQENIMQDTMDKNITKTECEKNENIQKGKLEYLDYTIREKKY